LLAAFYFWQTIVAFLLGLDPCNKCKGKFRS
jgi:hypothetical protein